jgi:hypothetical protein
VGELLTVLNGRDDLLEGLWAMELEPLFARLKQAEVRAVTGPTFSITGEHQTPASHNVLMLLRHHRVVDAINQAGLIPIPNLYWRTAADRGRWVEWLQQHPSVRVISRDFSRTKNRSSFRYEFEGLLEIVRGAGSGLHVVLVGVGTGKAFEAFHRLGDVGSTATIVSAEPVMRAIKHGLGMRREKGSVPTITVSQMTRFELAEANLMVMKEYLEDLAAEVGIKN